MSAEEILKPIIEQEFEKYERNGEKIKLPSMTKTRIKYTVWCVLGAWLSFPIALIVYIVLMIRTNKVNTILRLAKKSPDKPIDQIISEEMNSGSGAVIAVGVVAIIACLLGGCVGYDFLINTITGNLSNSNSSGLTANEDEGDEQEAIVNRGEETEYIAYGDGYKLVSCGLRYMDEEVIEIPQEYEGLAVVAIGEDAFSGFTNLKSVEIPGTVIEIGKRAFQNCSSLTTVSIPEGVRIIEGGAFMNCTQLSEVHFGSTVNMIGGECFKGCVSLERIEIPAAVTEIKGNCFEDCTALSEVILHDDLKEIRGYAFRNCSSLETITLPGKITEIRGNTFENCTALKSISIPDGAVRIAAHAFRNCSSLSEVYVPDTVEEIGSSAFRNCSSLREIEIPRNATVDERTFKDSPTEIIYK